MIASRYTLVLFAALLALPMAADAAEIVRFRLTAWKSIHLSDDQKAASITKTLKKLGCETEGHAHGDHHDVKYRCVKWRSIKLTSHEKAHHWEKWLKKLHFETRHEH